MPVMEGRAGDVRLLIFNDCALPAHNKSVIDRRFPAFCGAGGGGYHRYFRTDQLSQHYPRRKADGVIFQTAGIETGHPTSARMALLFIITLHFP